MTSKVEYRVALYCRLSKEDASDTESASIATQKSILSDYAKQNGWMTEEVYVDDGYSGTNFNRPAFQRMIKDIEGGKIDCVLTKDLSRLGRNYLDCGLYLEVFFPENNVRYIAVNDGVDTQNRHAMDITPFRNIINEMYASDISMKIKSAYKARFMQGKYMGTTAPYGYLKDPNDHNRLIIDEEVAPVVRLIFQLCIEGNGISKIRHYLNAHQILRPAAYAVVRGDTQFNRYFEEDEANRYCWSENSVRQVLRSHVYAGHLSGYKRIAHSMKSKRRPCTLPEKWTVIPNTHEPIISQEIFDTVQRLMDNRRGKNKTGFVNIFAGVIKCPDCGFAMSSGQAHRVERKDLIDRMVYSCTNYDRYGNQSCTAHKIEARDLYNAVLTDINRFAELALKNEKAVKTLHQKLMAVDTGTLKTLERDKRKLTRRTDELDKLFNSLYEDKVMERITERNFDRMSQTYQSEQQQLETRLAGIEEELSRNREKDRGVSDFLTAIQQYKGLKELDAVVINTLIERVEVFERKKQPDGSVTQEVKVYYKFVGLLDELVIEPTLRRTPLPEKNCLECGTAFVPKGGSAKYCKTCRPIVNSRRNTESTRRRREREKQAKLTA